MSEEKARRGRTSFQPQCVHVTVRFYIELQSDEAADRLARPMEWIRRGLRGAASVMWGEPSITVVTTTRDKVLDKLEAAKRGAK